ncbi:MAG: peptidylprolyl isomerase [Saprospiraceae bacterium]
MALIGTIRKNSWLLILVIGLALAAFIIMDMTSAGNRGGAVTSLAMGKVEGKTVDWNEFQGVESMLYSGSGDLFARRSQLWNYFVEEAIVSKQAGALGLNVSRDELIDLQFGANKSPVIINRFRNPQTGAVDVASLNQFRQQIQDGTILPEQKRFWAHQEKEIIKDRLQSKLNTMVSKGLYTPTWMVEQTYGDQTQRIAFDFVKVPFTEVDDSEISLTDADFSSYLAANKGTYMTTEETRRVNYVAFDVLPTASDSAIYRDKLSALIAGFEDPTTNDTIFVENNYGQVNPTWLAAADLPVSIQDAVLSTPVGKVYGPYLEGKSYQIVKVMERKALADSSDTRHILINATDPASFAAADAKIDSIKAVIEAGGDFEELAKTLSQDQGSAAKGGLYEKVPVNQFVPEYQDVMLNGQIGKLYKARTTYGVHLIEPLKRSRETTERVKIALIGQSITPSEDTQNAIFEEANTFLSKNRTTEAMQAAVAQSGTLTVENSGALKANDFSVGNLGSGTDARDIVKFAYDPNSEVGGVSASVYSFQDPVELYVNKYVVAALAGVEDAGMPSVASIKDEIEGFVRNQKKGEALKAKISGTDLNAIASQFDSEVENAKDVTFDATFVQGLGNEPEVIATAFNTAVNGVSKPIVGSSGVYIVKLKDKPAVGTAFNIPQLRKNNSSTAQTQVTARLMQAMKKNAEVEDLRSKFY